MSDGSFPIETKGDLSNAVSAYGRAADKAAAKRHITKRARALGATSMLPKAWGVKEAAVAKRTTKLPIANRDFRQELGIALVEDTVFAKDMSMAAAKALSGDPLQEAERSHDTTRQLVSQAIRDKWRKDDDDYGPWVREMYDDNVVFEHEGDTWQSTYSIDDENVTLGDRVEVEITYQPVVKPANESEPGEIPVEGSVLLVESATRPLLEKAVREDSTIEIKVIEPGRGSSGYYSQEVLERDAPVAFPTGTKMFWNHPTETELQERPERDLHDLAAELVSDASFNENGSEGPGVYAEAKVFGEYKGSVDELAGHIGTSIHASGAVDEAATGDDGMAGVVERILASDHNTIDFVTLPGAGGKVVELFESARGRRKPPAPRKEEPQMGDELKEAKDQLSEANTKLQEAEQARDAAVQERDDQKAELDRLQEGTLIREAKDEIAAMFEETADKAQIKVPTVARQRITERLADDPPKTDDGKLDKETLGKNLAEAIKAEAAYLAEITGSGKVTGLGESNGNGEPNEESEKKLTEAFKGLTGSDTAAEVAARGR